MVDVHSPAARSKNMAAIRSANTKPELTVRRALFRRGFRYRVHVSALPGKPDIVFPKYRAVVFVHGCFFHMHKCESFRWPSTRKRFWKDKIEGNAARDAFTEAQLLKDGWRVAVVWTCAIAGRMSKPIAETTNHLQRWLKSNRRRLEL